MTTIPAVAYTPKAFATVPVATGHFNLANPLAIRVPCAFATEPPVAFPRSVCGNLWEAVTSLVRVWSGRRGVGRRVRALRGLVRASGSRRASR
jgi:hypothetical protein